MATLKVSNYFYSELARYFLQIFKPYRYCSFAKVDLDLHKFGSGSTLRKTAGSDSQKWNTVQIHSPEIKGKVREGKEGGRDGKGKEE